MADDGQARHGRGLFSALGFSFSPTASAAPRSSVPGSVRQVVRGAAYPPLQAPLGPGEAAEIVAARYVKMPSQVVDVLKICRWRSSHFDVRCSEAGSMVEAPPAYLHNHAPAAFIEVVDVAPAVSENPALATELPAERPAERLGPVSAPRLAAPTSSARADPIPEAVIRGSLRASSVPWPDDPRATGVRVARFERALSGELTDVQVCIDSGVVPTRSL